MEKNEVVLRTSWHSEREKERENKSKMWQRKQIKSLIYWTRKKWSKKRREQCALCRDTFKCSSMIIYMVRARNAHTMQCNAMQCNAMYAQCIQVRERKNTGQDFICINHPIRSTWIIISSFLRSHNNNYSPISYELQSKERMKQNSDSKNAWP